MKIDGLFQLCPDKKVKIPRELYKHV